jgi:tellurite methyltransferase
MPHDWDNEYTRYAVPDSAPEPLLAQAADSLKAGKALDLACGAGRNAIYLAGLGWEVTAVDRSAAALRLLRRQAGRLGLDIRQADLERGEFPIDPEAYDLICDIRYLQRDLFPAIRTGVRPGGLFAGVILLQEPGHDSTFRLGPGELRAEFENWKILYYSEAGAARILARK